MRNRYFVCYDVSDPDRLVRTHKKMTGYGDRVQYSVFCCDLNRKELILMREDLEGIINMREDSVLIIDVGDAGGRGSSAVTSIGRQIDTREESAIVI